MIVLLTQVVNEHGRTWRRAFNFFDNLLMIPFVFVLPACVRSFGYQKVSAFWHKSCKPTWFLTVVQFAWDQLLNSIIKCENTKAWNGGFEMWNFGDVFHIYLLAGGGDRVNRIYLSNRIYLFPPFRNGCPSKCQSVRSFIDHFVFAWSGEGVGQRNLHALPSRCVNEERGIAV